MNRDFIALLTESDIREIAQFAQSAVHGDEETAIEMVLLNPRLPDDITRDEAITTVDSAVRCYLHDTK